MRNALGQLSKISKWKTGQKRAFFKIWTSITFTLVFHDPDNFNDGLNRIWKPSKIVSRNFLFFHALSAVFNEIYFQLDMKYILSLNIPFF